jgi:adenylate kinase family enzyme
MELPPIPKASLPTPPLKFSIEEEAPPTSPPSSRKKKLAKALGLNGPLEDWEPGPPLPPTPKAALPKGARYVHLSIQSFEEKWQTPTLESVDYEQDSSSLSQDQIIQYLSHSDHTRIDPVSHGKLGPSSSPPPPSLQDSQSYLEKIKMQRRELEVSRRNRDQRRKKLLVQLSQKEMECEGRAVEELLLLKLQRASKQERRIGEQLLQTRHEKEVMRENRVLRQEQYTHQRDLEFRQALTREKFLFKQDMEGYRDQVGMHMVQHVELMRMRREKDHDRSMLWIRTHLVEELINLAFKISDYKLLTDGKEVPQRRLGDWKRIIHEGLSIREFEEVDWGKNQISCLEVEKVVSDLPPEIKLLDSEEFHNYLNYGGAWDSQLDGVIRNNDNLAAVIEQLVSLTKVEEQGRDRVTLPNCPLRISILGKKFSGKRTVASGVAKKYGMSVLYMDDLIKDAISLAEVTQKTKARNSPPETKDGKKAPLTKTQIGAKIQLALLEGASPDDTLLVQLAIDAMSHETEPGLGGWILVDFPKTKLQAQMLERELSGYEDPKPSKKGDLKRSGKGSGPNSGANRNRSMIAGTDNPADAQVGYPTSGFDAFFLIDAKNETCFKRAVGQVVDPLTGQGYHLENKPPPINAPGTIERLVPVDDASRSISQLQYHLAAFEGEQEELVDWIGQFKNLNVRSLSSFL